MMGFFEVAPIPAFVSGRHTEKFPAVFFRAHFTQMILRVEHRRRPVSTCDNLKEIHLS